jgi:hypothetical protein
MAPLDNKQVGAAPDAQPSVVPARASRVVEILFQAVAQQHRIVLSNPVFNNADHQQTVALLADNLKKIENELNVFRNLALLKAPLEITQRLAEIHNISKPLTLTIDTKLEQAEKDLEESPEAYKPRHQAAVTLYRELKTIQDNVSTAFTNAQQSYYAYINAPVAPKSTRPTKPGTWKNILYGSLAGAITGASVKTLFALAAAQVVMPAAAVMVTTLAGASFAGALAGVARESFRKDKHHDWVKRAIVKGALLGGLSGSITGGAAAWLMDYIGATDFLKKNAAAVTESEFGQNILMPAARFVKPIAALATDTIINNYNFSTAYINSWFKSSSADPVSPAVVKIDVAVGPVLPLTVKIDAPVIPTPALAHVAPADPKPEASTEHQPVVVAVVLPPAPPAPLAELPPPPAPAPSPGPRPTRTADGARATARQVPLTAQQIAAAARQRAEDTMASRRPEVLEHSTADGIEAGNTTMAEGRIVIIPAFLNRGARVLRAPRSLVAMS